MSGLDDDFGNALSIDQEADAAYLYLTGVAEVATTVQFNADINVDLDATGAAVGIEVLSLQAEIPVEALCERFRLDRRRVEALTLLRP